MIKENSHVSEALNHLWRGGGYTYYWTDNGRKSLWFSVDKTACVPADWQNKNVFFGIHPCNVIPPENTRGEQKPPAEVRSQLRYISAINCLFGEYDAKDEVQEAEYIHFLPDNFSELKPVAQNTAIKNAKEAAYILDPIEYKRRAFQRIDQAPLFPTMIIDSGGGYHAYWFLQETVTIDDDNRERIKTLQAEWVDVVGSDSVSKDLTRVLRVPGTKNVKDLYAPDYPTVTVIEYEPSRLFNLSDFERVIGIDDVGEKATKTVERTRKDNAQTDDVISEFNRTHKLVDMLASNSYILSWQNDKVARLARPGRGKHQPSVTVFKDGDKELSYHHSSNDSMHTGAHCLDAFEMHTLLDHAGDRKKAYEATKRAQGKWVEEQPRQVIDPDTGEITFLSKVYENGNGPHVEPVCQNEYARPTEAMDIDNFLLAQSADDEGNAQCVMALHGDEFLYSGAYGWLQNAGTHWSHEGLAEANTNIAITETLIRRRVLAVKHEKEAIVKATKPSATNKENVKRQFRDRASCDAKVFDEEKYLLNTMSGVIDLRNGKLVSHDPSNRFTYCINAEYGIPTNCPSWISFISEAVKDYAEIQDWLQMACGYSVTGFTSEEIMFYMYGPARSGKGTFANAFLTMLGQPLARGVNFSMFTSRREGDSQNFDLAPLKPTRFISASESSKYQSLNEAVVKQITGNDPISASFKGKDGFNYFPQFKIWLSSNHPVKGDVDDDAFWGRIKVIEFPNSHLGEEDKSLKERMQSSECRNALLAYAVEGARMWFNEAKGLKTPEVVKKSTGDQRDALDSIQRWLDECVKRMEGINTPNDDLRRSYTEWCEHNGENPKVAVHFGRAMQKKGFEPTKIKMHGLDKRGYKDIGIIYAER